ncbi:MAG: preprotein translocase subunit SecA [Candidatus Shapirobacteria bacterium]
MFRAFKNLFDDSARQLSQYKKIVAQINFFESTIKPLTDDQLKSKTTEFKDRLNKGESLDSLLPQAYAVIREAIFRTIGERAYDVQLLAAITLHHGAIAEQRTGEGKTHSVIFPAYLNSLTGKGVHIITPNDYLTRVGAGWYPQALNLLGISTACIVHEQSFILDSTYTEPTETVDPRLSHLRPVSRQEAYLADVTYGTNNEFGFDYLRDHMVTEASQKVQRPDPYFAIVDEVDFVLIDEARTPLIISSPGGQPTDNYYQFAQIAAGLQETDYSIDEKSRSATLTEYGIRKVERILKVNNLYEQSFETIHYIENAIKARALFHKDRDYVVKDGEIIIVDEFTGRLMNGRRWSDGLHQAVEAKENVTVQQESQTWATITFQNYFRLYEKLAGMTGTALTEAEEFRKIYQLEVITIPTHRSLARRDSHDLIFKSQRSKYAAIATQVEELHRLGQPVLIGTTSIEKNQIISSLLAKKGVPHQLLNAKNHRSEAEIIAKAGTLGAVTVATNMAGRGVDIILGGPRDNVEPSKWQELHDKVVALGGLYVIGTERHESRRIDNQLRGRAGRQGDPGFSQFYIALDDDLMRIFGGEKISDLMTRFQMPDDTPLTHPLVSRVIEQIQVKVEGFNFDIRKNLVEYDDVINKQRRIVYSLRDRALADAQANPEALWVSTEKYFQNEINRLVDFSVNPDSGETDYSRVASEFSEILPHSEKDRQALSDALKKPPSSQDIKDFLFKQVKSQWEQRVTYFGQSLATSVLTYCIVRTLDPLWVEHLTALDDLRDGVRLRGYAQKDPLIEYRKEGYDMFQSLMVQFESNFSRTLFRLEPVQSQPASVPQPAVSETRGKASDYASVSSDSQPDSTPQEANGRVVTSTVPIESSALGRNDPCWCGSGKKWKKCHYPQLQ